MLYSSKNSLTPQQQRVYSYIVECRRKTGIPPTVREIADGLGYRSINNVRQHLKLIEKKGHLRLVSGKARGIEITGAAVDFETEHNYPGNIPLIGSVAAGLPITAAENLEGYITIDKTLFRGEDLFALRIKGDSMKGIGILNGDMVVIRPVPAVRHNEVVVAVVNGDATLKRFIQEKDGRIFLRAENEAYRDMELSEDQDITIAGKLIGVIRKF